MSCAYSPINVVQLSLHIVHVCLHVCVIVFVCVLCVMVCVCVHELACVCVCETMSAFAWVNFFGPTQTQSPFAMCQNAQSKKKGHVKLFTFTSICISISLYGLLGQ